MRGQELFAHGGYEVHCPKMPDEDFASRLPAELPVCFHHSRDDDLSEVAHDIGSLGRSES